MNIEEQEVQEELEQEPPEQEEQPEPVDEESQAEARKYGWKPKDEFSLDPEGWVDADRFLELPSTQRKQLSDINRDLSSRLEVSERKADMAAKEAAKAAKLAVEQQKQQYESKIAYLTGQQRDAVETADGERFEKLEAAKQKLQSEVPKEPEPEQPDIRQHPLWSADYETKMNSKAWTKDPILSDFAATAIDKGVLPDGRSVRTIPFSEQIDYAENIVKEYFPQKFQAPAASQQTAKVDGGGLGAAPKAKGVNSLPAEARKAGKEFVEQGLFKTMEEYAKVYHAGDE